MALYWPVNAPVTQHFATNPNSIQPNGHTGMDFGCPVGTSVKAAGAGTVVWADWATKLSASNIWWVAPAFAGITVILDHGNGQLTLYAHLNSTNLNIGARVAQGAEIGKSGNTGLSTGPHLHFEILGWPLAPYNGFYGRLDPKKFVSSLAPAGNTTITLKANQRRVGKANVNQRAQANNNSAIVRTIPANSIEEFIGYVIGESITIPGVAGVRSAFTSNIWYKDAKGYAWSGGFETQTTTGLPNLTPPPPLKANERMVGADNANLRMQPNDSSAVIRVIPAKTKEVFTGYVIGESIKNINIWFKDDKGYAWAGGFESQATTGLPNLTPVPPKPPVPPTPTEPTEADRTRIAKTEPVNMRSLPYTNSEVIRVIAPNSKEIFTEYVQVDDADAIDGNPLWFKDDKGYAWSGGFTSQATAGLKKAETPAKPIVIPPVPPVITDPPVVPPKVTTLKGIDISNHQPGIDVSKIDTDFVIIKATEGVGWSDPQFKKHIQNARAAGKLIGFYHFARPLATLDNTAKAEADTFIATIYPDMQNGDIVVLDWEAENQSNTQWAKEWLDRVADVTGASPLVYMNLSTANAYNWSSVNSHYKLWLAQYPSTANQGWGPIIEKHGEAKDWQVAMWQYSSSGRLSGWGADLDLNVFYGSDIDWKALGAQKEDIPSVTDPTYDAEKARLMEILEQAIDQYLAEKGLPQ